MSYVLGLLTGLFVGLLVAAYLAYVAREAQEGLLATISDMVERVHAGDYARFVQGQESPPKESLEFDDSGERKPVVVKTYIDESGLSRLRVES